MGFGDVGAYSRKAAPVGVEKPACAGVFLLRMGANYCDDWISALRAEI